MSIHDDIPEPGSADISNAIAVVMEEAAAASQSRTVDAHLN